LRQWLRQRGELAQLTRRLRPRIDATPADRTFKMPYVTIEAVLREGRDRLAIVNDTNFGSRGRSRNLPDYSDFIGVRVPDLVGQRKGDG
jgi:hypothetical protein